MGQDVLQVARLLAWQQVVHDDRDAAAEGFGQGQTVSITPVANQPANYNNVQPTYGSDGSIIFVSDQPRNKQR